MQTGLISFNIDPRVSDLGIMAVCFIIEGLNNQARSPEFDHYYERELRAILADLLPESIKNDPVLQGYRQLHTSAGISNRKTNSASENLLRYLSKTVMEFHCDLRAIILSLRA